MTAVAVRWWWLAAPVALAAAWCAPVPARHGSDGGAPPAAVVAPAGNAGVSGDPGKPGRSAAAPHLAATDGEPPPAADHADTQPTAAALAAVADPARSDLPAELFTRLAALGAAVVRADATGVGREAFPGYWDLAGGTGRASPCCDEVTVGAAGAFTDPADPRRVQVRVIWSGRRAGPPGGQVDAVTVVYLVRTGDGWAPLPAWETHR